MIETVACPKCNRRLQLPEEYIGRDVQCPGCASVFLANTNPQTAFLPDSAPIRPAPLQIEDNAADPYDEPQPRRTRRPAHARFDQPALKPNRSKAGIAILVVVGVVVLQLVRLALNNRNENRNPAPVPQVNWQLPPNDPLVMPVPKIPLQLPLTKNQIQNEIKPFLTKICRAYQARSGRAMLALYDIDRMVDQLSAMKIFPANIGPGRWDIIRTMQSGLIAPLESEARALQVSNTFQIRHIKKLAGNEAEVVVHHREKDGKAFNVRWYVTKRSGAWRVYDMEYLASGMKISMSGASCVVLGYPNALRNSNAIYRLYSAMIAAFKKRPDDAERTLRLLAATKLPNSLECLRQLAKGFIDNHRLRDADAIKRYDQAAKFNSDLPCVWRFKGLSLVALSRWSEAIQCLKKYKDLTGGDNDVCYQFGVALSRLQRFDEACTEYRKALDFRPKDTQAFSALLRAIGPKSDHSDIEKRFTKVGNHRPNFDRFAEDCRRGRNAKALEPLAKAMMKLDAAYLPARHYLALAYIWNKKSKKGIALFVDALSKQNNKNTKELWTKDFLGVAVDMRKEMVAYKALPDSRNSFRILAASLRYQVQRLQTLIVMHAKQHADDWSLHMYRGVVFMRKNQFENARKAFAKGLAKNPKQESLDSFRYDRILAAYHTGNGLSAYKSLESKDKTFSQLANLYYNAEKYAPLQELINLHARNHADDPLLSRFRWRIQIKHDKVSEAVTIYQSAFDDAQQSSSKSKLTSDFLMDMVDAQKPLLGYRAVEDRKKAFKILAGDLLGFDRTKDLRRLLIEHTKEYRDDYWIPYYQAELCRREKEWQKAVAYYEAASKKMPATDRTQLQYNYIFTLYKAGRWQDAYGKINTRKYVFAQLARLMTNDKNFTALNKLFAVHRPFAANDPDFFYHQAYAKFREKKNAEGKTLLAKALDLQPLIYRRRSYVQDIARSLTRNGRGSEAYRTLPDPISTFPIIAGRLVSEKKAGQLEQLIAEHRRKHSDDVWTHFYSGEAQLLQGDVKMAVKSFRKAYDHQNAAAKWQTRNGLLRSLVKSGKLLEEYDDLLANQVFFTDMANACVTAKDAKQLKELIDTHRKKSPDDVTINAWELDLKWISGEFDAALQWLQKNEKLRSLPANRWKYENYLVRCLLKTKQNKRALSEAESIVKKNGNRLLLILAHAASGDVKQTIATMQRFSSDQFLLGNCYRDDDLGPLLQTDAFAEFRKLFPEPSKN